MIYTLTFNPAIDYVMRIDELREGATNRSREEEIHFGGKGVNVSVVLSRLGVQTTALGFVAGFTGEALLAAIAKCGIRADFIRLSVGHTRINVKLKGIEETEINACGPEIDETALLRLYEKLERISEGDTLVLSGSVPPSLTQNVYADILYRLKSRGIRFVVDASGMLLTSTLPYHPFLIKPNRAELEEILGEMLATDDDVLRAAQELQVLGAVNVLVSLGGDGAILIDEFGTLHRRSAVRGKAVNTVGAGDSMVAGFLAGLGRGYDYALSLGIAAGSATAFSTGLATRDEIIKLI